MEEGDTADGVGAVPAIVEGGGDGVGVAGEAVEKVESLREAVLEAGESRRLDAAIGRPEGIDVESVHFGVYAIVEIVEQFHVVLSVVGIDEAVGDEGSDAGLGDSERQSRIDDKRVVPHIGRRLLSAEALGSLEKRDIVTLSGELPVVNLVAVGVLSGEKERASRLVVNTIKDVEGNDRRHLEVVWAIHIQVGQQDEGADRAVLPSGASRDVVFDLVFGADVVSLGRIDRMADDDNRATMGLERQFVVEVADNLGVVTFFALERDAGLDTDILEGDVVAVLGNSAGIRAVIIRERDDAELLVEGFKVSLRKSNALRAKFFKFPTTFAQSRATTSL